jgi:hypothetical protein
MLSTQPNRRGLLFDELAGNIDTAFEASFYARRSTETALAGHAASPYPPAGNGSTPGRHHLIARLTMGLLLRLAGIFVASVGLAAASDQPAATVNINIDKPTSYWLAAGTTGLLPPTPSNRLALLPPENIGWFDYDFVAEWEGWYQLVVTAPSHIGGTEFLFDNAGTASTLLDRNTPAGNGRYSAGWVWLTQGSHQLRVQHLFWTGFSPINAIQLEPAQTNQAFIFRVIPPQQTSFALGACEPLELETGGNKASFAIDLSFRRGGSSTRRRLVIPPSSSLARSKIDLPCDLAGDVGVDLSTSSGSDSLNVRARVDYAVFNTSRVEPVYERGELAAEINLADRQPDFRASDSSVVSEPGEVYRATGTNGSTPYVRYNARSFTQRLISIGENKRPSWFAYRVEGLLPGEPYIVEVDYPDDQPRVFVVAIRSSNGRGYPTSIGAETGVIWPLSKRMEKMSAIVWPSSSDVRVIVFNIHNGMKAAVGRIRFYKAIFRQTSQPASPREGRDVIFWNEEGDHFRDVVGESHDPGAAFTPIDRYLSLARSAGATIVSPTVAIYNFALYPSRFHLTFADKGRDMTAGFMLGAERYGLKVVPQLHPRADELIWPPRDQTSLQKRLLLSAQGQTHLLRPDGDFYRPPFYNPLNTDVRRWYIDMIGELADRYKDYPAFSGIDLRVSDWQNPTLNNFESLDWGYEADTVALFFKEAGLAAPGDLDLSSDRPAAAKLRHRYLLERHRAAWLKWRCEKIADIFREATLRVRSARPDLRLYVSMFGQRTWNVETAREFGIDIDLLSKIDGLSVVDVRLGHGAREPELDWRHTQHADLTGPQVLGPTSREDTRPNIIFPMEYIEITGIVAPSGALDLSPPPREPWVSSATEPPGRLALARYAAAIGLADPYMIGDGGNGYVFGHDIETLRAFMNEFRSLPRRPFHRIAEIPDAIIVRQSKDMFYVVNMLNVPVSANLLLNEPGSVRRATSGDIITAADKTASLDLQPYEMAALVMDKGSRVTGAQVALSKEAEADFSARARSYSQAASAACASLFKGSSCANSRRISGEINTAIDRHDYWTAERLLTLEQ